MTDQAPTPTEDEPVEVLKAFVDRTGFDPTDPFAELPESSVTERTSALDHLRQTHTGPVGEVVPDLRWWDAVAARLIADWPQGSRQFIDEVMFDVRSPGQYQVLMPTIHWLLGADRLVDSLIDVLRRGSDIQRSNALGMLYYAFGHRDSPQLGARRDDLVAALEELRAAADVGPRTAKALAGTSVPTDVLG